MGSDGVLIDERRSGRFQWSFDWRGFCGGQSFYQRIYMEIGF